MKVVKIGSRDSKLAIIQAQMVISAIKDYDSTIVTELITMKTTGDKILDKSLDKIGGKGLFVKELDDALLNGDVDITVHSFKDMPMEINENLPIVALSKREDPRDVLILPKTQPLEELPIGCSSKRRSIQLNRLGHKEIKSLRGNVITRLKKLDDHNYRAIILAAAGIKRLGLTERISKYFSTEEIMPSACQGIVAVQARRGENTDYLALFNDDESHLIAKAERAFVKQLGGGCTSPVAAYAVIDNNSLVLKGLYADEEKNIYLKGMAVGNALEGETLGVSLANNLLKDAER